MPNLWGRQFSRAELMARIGDVSQVGGVREYRLDGGAGDGLPVVDVSTGSGLRFTVIPGRALDINGAWFNGIPLGFRSAAGEMHGAYYEPEGWGWVRSTVLGLLVTGGLDNVGDPAVDPDRLYTDMGLHGRLSNLGASNVHADGEWRGDEYEMWVQGRVRQAAALRREPGTQAADIDIAGINVDTHPRRGYKPRCGARARDDPLPLQPRLSAGR